ncbi:MAG TPA: hypothetical protein DC054_01750 [Blastocatellia bacterium]|nr:hypothetical protein [Blastocatellia bacterium]
MNDDMIFKICLLAALGVYGMTSLVRPQPKDTIKLDRTIPDLQITGAPTSLVLQRVAGSSSVPIGIEALPEIDGQTRTIDVRLKGATVRAVLDLVVKKDPRYVWQTAGPVINVFPKGPKDPLLGTIVSHFEVKNVNREEAIRALENSIEVQKILAETSLSDRTLKSLPGDSEYGLPKFSLDLKDSSVRSILNSIMLKSSSKSWVFFRYGARKDSFSVLMH